MEAFLDNIFSYIFGKEDYWFFLVLFFQPPE